MKLKLEVSFWDPQPLITIRTSSVTGEKKKHIISIKSEESQMKAGNMEGGYMQARAGGGGHCRREGLKIDSQKIKDQRTPPMLSFFYIF